MANSIVWREEYCLLMHSSLDIQLESVVCLVLSQGTVIAEILTIDLFRHLFLGKKLKFLMSIYDILYVIFFFQHGMKI